MNDLNWLAVSIAGGAVALAAAVVFLATRAKGMVNVTVTQPPITVTQPEVTVNTPPITVTSPPAILPPELLETLRQVQEKLQPPPQPLLDDSQLLKLVEEGVALAAQMKGVKGPDKFRAARTYVLQQAQGRGLAVDERALALSIEAAVLSARAAKK